MRNIKEITIRKDLISNYGRTSSLDLDFSIGEFCNGTYLSSKDGHDN